MANLDVSTDQFEQIMERFGSIDQRLDGVDKRIDDLEKRMITKADVFQSVLTVQTFFAATIVGCIVVLNAVGALA